MKLNYFLAMLVAAATTVACTKTDDPTPDPEPTPSTPKLVVSGSNAISVSSTSSTVNLTVTANVSWTMTSDQNWVNANPAKADITDGKDVATTVVLTVDPNEAEQERTAKLTFSGADVDAVTVTLTQEAFVPAPTYTFSLSVTNVTPSSASISCTPSDNSVTYLRPAFLTSALASIPEDQVASEILNAFRQQYADYGNYQGNFTSVEDLIYRGLGLIGPSNSNLSNLSPSTSYTVYAFAIDQNLNVISDVFKSEFTTGEADMTAYNKWLGTWTVPATTYDEDGNLVETTSNFTISANTAGTSYNVFMTSAHDMIQGLPELVAYLDGEDLVFRTVSNIGTMNDTQYGSVTLMFMGECYFPGDAQYEEGVYIITGNYDIVKLSLDASGNSATYEPQTVSVNGLGDLETVDMAYLGRTTSNQYLLYSDVFTFTGAVTKASGSSASVKTAASNNYEVKVMPNRKAMLQALDSNAMLVNLR